MNSDSCLNRGFRAWLAGVLIPFGVALAGVAQANQVFTTDCDFGLTDYFPSNQAVCATGDVDTVPPGFVNIFPEGGVCVVAAGSVTSGGAIGDVTAGGCNTVIGTGLGGAFFDETVWLPPLTAGLFDIVLDENQNGVFDGPDALGYRFRVGDPTGADIDVAAIKGDAEGKFNRFKGLADHWHWVSDASTAVSVAWAVSLGDWVSVGASVFGTITGLPTDYNRAVLNSGGKLIEGLAAQAARKYEDLKNDPPDPNYADFAGLDLAQVNADLAAEAALYPGIPLVYPFSTVGSSAYEAAQIALANASAEQVALVRALTTTLEKYQGADAAGNDEFVLQQALALQGYADALVENLTDTKQFLSDYAAEQAALGFDAVVYSAAEIQALVDRINASGLTPAEIQSLEDSGFAPADITFLLDRTAALASEVPAADVTRGGTLAALITEMDNGIATFQNLSAEAAAVVADRQPFVIPQFPVADAGGPYSGPQDVPISLDGSASSDPNGDALTFEWDFNLDGLFDDAFGANVDFISEIATRVPVGLKVTDTDGNSSVAYATVTVTAVNQPPVIDSFSPSSLSPTASPSSPLDFSVTASDPDSDPLTYQWTLDQVPVSTAQTYTYTPAAGDPGTRIVKVTVSDGNALTVGAVEYRVVLIESAPTVEIIVPDVVGLTQADAEATIVAASLSVGAVTTTNSGTVPTGNVISQDPGAGASVPLGSAVDLVVSLGPAPVAVPDVVGDTQTDAQAAILAAGLAVGTVTTANSDTVLVGSVISQDPAGGSSVAPGTAVDLVVSLGPAPVTVPDVVGDTQADAQAAILAAGLAVGTVTTANSDTVLVGSVISQDPAGGSSVAPGTAVDLVVSLGLAPVVVQCDADGDGDIDRLDLRIISASRRQSPGPGDPRDGNSDGKITPADVLACIPQCALRSCVILP